MTGPQKRDKRWLNLLITLSWEEPTENDEGVVEERLDDCAGAMGNGMMFHDAKQQAMYLEMAVIFSARRWELSSCGKALMYQQIWS